MAPRKFSQELKDEAVRAVVDSSRAVAEVAREFGINPQTLRNWVGKYRREHVDQMPALSESEQEELARLRKENRELKMQSEFLGKAAAFFAKEYR